MFVNVENHPKVTHRRVRKMEPVLVITCGNEECVLHEEEIVWRPSMNAKDASKRWNEVHS